MLVLDKFPHPFLLYFLLVIPIDQISFCQLMIIQNFPCISDRMAEIIKEELTMEEIEIKEEVFIREEMCSSSSLEEALLGM